jgi:WD40 repeat protein
MTVEALAGGPRPAVVAEVVHVVAAGEQGGMRLMLAVMDGGPPGLHPDPERMALLRPTEAFAAAVGDAWVRCPLARQGRSVLWAAEGVDGEPLRTADGDLGRAFAPALAEVGVNARATGLRLRLPTAVAAWPGRFLRCSRPLLAGLAGAVTATALVMLTLHLTGWHSGDDRSVVAARLSARALGVAAEDPRLAAQLALAAHSVDPTDQTAGLLRQLSEDEQYVARRFDTGDGTLDAIAQDDGRQMVFTAGPDGGIQAWSSWSGTRLGRVSGASGIVALACDPAAPLLAGADSKGDVLLWRTGDLSRVGAPVRLHMPYLGGSEGRTVGLGFSHDGTLVYRVAGNGEVRVWDTRTHATLSADDDSLKAPGHQYVTPVAVSSPYAPGGHGSSESVLIGTDDAGIVSYDLRTHRTANLLGAGQARGPLTALTADASTGTLTVAAGSPAGLSLWSLGARHHEIYPYAGITASVDALTHRSDGTLAVGTDQGVDLLTTDGGVTTPRPQGGYAGQFASSTSSDGRDLVVGGAGDTVTVLDVRGAGLAPATGGASTVLAYDARGDLLLSSTDAHDWSTGLYTVRPDPHDPARGDSTTRTRRAFLPGAHWWPKGSSFYANAGALTSSFVAAAGQDPDFRAAVLVWDARTGRALRHIVFPGDENTTPTDPDLPPNIAVSVLFDTRLHLMVARDTSGQVAAWSTRTWRLALRVSTGAAGGGGLALSPDGRSALLTVGSAKLNDVAVRNRLVSVDLRTRRVDSVALDRWTYAVAYAPDGSRVAALSTDDTVSFLNPAGRRLPGTPVIHLPGPAAHLAYSPNGRLLAVADGLGKVLVYRTADGQLAYPAFQLPAGESAVDVAWDPSGTLLTATGGVLGDHPHVTTTYFWPLAYDRWASRVCALGGGDLTRAAWAEYVGSSTPYRPLCGRHG